MACNCGGSKQQRPRPVSNATPKPSSTSGVPTPAAPSATGGK